MHPSGDLGGGFQLLPFLDIVIAMVGIFLVVFVLQSISTEPQLGLAGVDELILCEDGQTLHFYADPQATVVAIPRARQQALFEQLPASEQVRNLSFAFTHACFATKAAFERAFAAFSRLLERDGAPTRRLNFRPLSSEVGSSEALLARWRGAMP